MITRFWLLIATGLGTGYAPVASGTFGTLVGIPIVYLMQKHYSPSMQLVAAFVLLLVGVKASAVAERHFEKSDPGQVVIDEIVGFMLAMYLVPFSFKTAVIAFLLFRFFDVVKPWPANVFDRKPGPWSVMLDDVFAGVYANIVLQIFFWIGLVSRPM